MLKALPSSDWLSIRSLSFKRAVYRVASLLRKEVANRILIGGSESPLLFTILLLGTLYAEKTPILMGADTSTRLPMKEAFDLLLLGETESSSGLEALPHLQTATKSALKKSMRFSVHTPWKERPPFFFTHRGALESRKKL